MGSSVGVRVSAGCGVKDTVEGGGLRTWSKLSSRWGAGGVKGHVKVVFEAGLQVGSREGLELRSRTGSRWYAPLGGLPSQPCYPMP